MYIDPEFSNMKPIKFHPYSHVVTNRIFEIDFFHICSNKMEEKFRNDSIKNEYDGMRELLVDRFNEFGIKAVVDNKTVFEMEINGTKIFYGFFDFVFSIGLGVKRW